MSWPPILSALRSGFPYAVLSVLKLVIAAAERIPHLYPSFLCVVTSCHPTRAVITGAASTLSPSQFVVEHVLCAAFSCSKLSELSSQQERV